MMPSSNGGQWRGALMFSLTCVWINGWVNNREAGDLRRKRAHYDVIVMQQVIIDPSNGLAPHRRQAIAWTNDSFELVTEAYMCRPSWLKVLQIYMRNINIRWTPNMVLIVNIYFFLQSLFFLSLLVLLVWWWGGRGGRRQRRPKWCG